MKTPKKGGDKVSGFRTAMRRLVEAAAYLEELIGWAVQGEVDSSNDRYEPPPEDTLERTLYDWAWKQQASREMQTAHRESDLNG